MFFEYKKKMDFNYDDKKKINNFNGITIQTLF